MKKVVFVFSLFLFGLSAQSQEVKKNKSAKVTFEVDGVCGMCQKRIETAVLKTKGVKYASWNISTHQLNLIMDERKTDVETIQQSVLAVGHDIVLDTENRRIATDEAYNSIHGCCKYREEEVVLEHQD